MRAVALWRFPVKSLQGERCEALELTSGGVAGDRSLGVLDVAAGTILSGKRDGRLLEGQACWRDGEVRVRVPGDRVERPPGAALDDAVTRWLGLAARVVAAASHGVGTFESHEDAWDDASTLVRWEGIDGSFVDESHLHLVTTGDLDRLAGERPELQWDARRFRPNAVVEAPAGWLAVGSRLQLGTAAVEVVKGCTRCAMTTRPQPGGLVHEPDLLRHVRAAHDNVVGVRARVVRPGWLGQEDAVEVAVAAAESG